MLAQPLSQKPRDAPFVGPERFGGLEQKTSQRMPRSLACLPCASTSLTMVVSGMSDNDLKVVEHVSLGDTQPATTATTRDRVTGSLQRCSDRAIRANETVRNNAVTASVSGTSPSWASPE